MRYTTLGSERVGRVKNYKVLRGARRMQEAKVRRRYGGGREEGGAVIHTWAL